MSKESSNNKRCDYNNFKRTRYFHGMLLTDRDFREEQIYHNEKRKLLNKMLHGWGVVCGLGLKKTSADSSKIIITPGMALDCHGNEIVVCENVEIDLKKEKICPETEKTRDICAEMKEAETPGYYIGIKYNESPTDPVPVYAPGGGCEEKVCDYSRTREGFCVKIFDKADYPYQPRQCSSMESLANRVYDCRQLEENGEYDYPEECLKEKAFEFKSEFCAREVCCPECCPTEHYLILGSVQYNANTKKYAVSLNEGRQYVITVPFFKYLFSTLFNGAEKILKDVVDEFKDVTVPDVNLLHQNPIAALCWLGEQFIEIEKKIAEPSKPARQIEGMSRDKAVEYLESRKLRPVSTVILTPENKMRLAALSAKAKEVEEDDPVEIVVDDRNNAKFFIPAREKVAIKILKKELDESRKSIGELKTKMEELKPGKIEKKK